MITFEEVKEMFKKTIDSTDTMNQTIENLIQSIYLREYNEALEQQPCDDAISRQAVLNILKDKWNMFSDANDAMQESIDTIEALSPVTPQPKMGRWISFGAKGEIDGQIYNSFLFQCHIVRTFTSSECGAISIFRVTNGNIVNGDLCPNCGAKMQEEADGK